MRIGKSIRSERIFNRNTNRTIIVPVDHGVTVGPIHGLVDFKGTVNNVAEGGANAVLMHKGLVRCGHRTKGQDIGLILHLSASTSVSPMPNTKTLVSTVEEALKQGADAVSVHVNLGDENERLMLKEVGLAAESAADWGMPFLAMMYARGPKVQDEYDAEVIKHCARVGMELGADIVKVNYPGDPESFAQVVEGCCVPVVIAGGEKLDSDRDLVQMVHDSVQAGGSGLSVGRNVFQHRRPDILVKALHGVVHDDWSVDQAVELIETV
ncbi:MAG: fructose-bisphosphate aldolase [Desulfovibrio sp.]|nr:MAG: fructose-bisphosphate aldolase [Desulfovibrio sp.]